MGTKPLTYLLLYIPIALVSSLVLTAAKEDGMENIVPKGLKTFGLLSLAIFAGAAVVWFVQRFA